MYNKGLSLTLPRKMSKPIQLNPADIVSLKLDGDGRLYEDGKLTTPERIVVGSREAVIIKVHSECRYVYLVELIESLKSKDVEKLSIKKL